MSGVKKPRAWYETAGIVFLSCVLLFFIWAIFIADDDEKQAEDGPKAYTSKHVDDKGPYSEELYKYTKKIDLDAFSGNWEFSIVEDDFGGADGVKVKSGKGMVVLYSQCELAPESFISSMVDTGDAIVWSKKMDDLNICDREVYVVRTAAELREMGLSED